MGVDLPWRQVLNVSKQALFVGWADQMNKTEKHFFTVEHTKPEDDFFSIELHSIEEHFVSVGKQVKHLFFTCEQTNWARFWRWASMMITFLDEQPTNWFNKCFYSQARGDIPKKLSQGYTHTYTHIHIGTYIEIFGLNLKLLGH